MNFSLSHHRRSKSEAHAVTAVQRPGVKQEREREVVTYVSPMPVFLLSKLLPLLILIRKGGSSEA